MPGISDISIIDSNTSATGPFDAGTQSTLCSRDLCGANNLTVYKKTILKSRRFDLAAGSEYHLVYVLQTPTAGQIQFQGKTHPAEEGAGVLLAPSESARFEVSGSDMQILHMTVPKPPAAVEAGLPGGPGYYFDRKLLRVLTDASGGRIRRFCAESSVRLRDGSRLTPTNVIQAGEMHYVDGGSSPYHQHDGTEANPGGAAHCYMTFRGRGLVEVGDESREIEPGTLVYFPPGIPHRLRAHGGSLDYFEIQAWRSFKTTILSEEPLGLRWYYERENPGDELTEWNQS